MEFNASKMTNEELQVIIVKCEQEMQSRKKQRNETLIKNFKEAFCALRENYICLRYTDEEQEVYRAYIEDFDGFEFFD